MAGDRDSDAGNGSPSPRPSVEPTNDAVTSISAVEDSVVHEVSKIENAELQEEMLGTIFRPLTLDQVSASSTSNVLDSPVFFDYDTDEREAELSARREQILQAVANVRDSGRDNEQEEMSKTERDGLRDLIIEARSHSDEEIDDLLKALFPTKEEIGQTQAHQASFTSRFSDDTESSVDDNEEVPGEAAVNEVADVLATNQQAETMHSDSKTDIELRVAPHGPRDRATISGPANTHEAGETSAGNTEDTDEKGGQKIWKRLKSLTLSAEDQALEKEKAEKKRRAEKFDAAANWNGSEEDYEEWARETFADPEERMKALVYRMRSKLNAKAQSYVSGGSLPRHPDTSKGWNHKNLRCTNCPQITKCPLCQDPCCAWQQLTDHIARLEQNPGRDEAKLKEARTALKNVERIFPTGGEVPTFLLCTTCYRRVCPHCCGQCPDEEVCKDIQCRECKSDPWELCGWHAGL